MRHLGETQSQRKEKEIQAEADDQAEANDQADDQAEGSGADRKKPELRFQGGLWYRKSPPLLKKENYLWIHQERRWSVN